MIRRNEYVHEGTGKLKKAIYIAQISISSKDSGASNLRLEANNHRRLENDNRALRKRKEGKIQKSWILPISNAIVNFLEEVGWGGCGTVAGGNLSVEEYQYVEH
ncbi:hypothetical protein ACH5RR_022497 [Cinchona calisaya]|uniref:Uncharacterized protein n=1 Tax=Cinchona calisaya TaxID=153742 RepID=A0ABD2ZBD1_9GENT